MLEKFKEIAKAWITSHNPSTEQSTLAEKRFEICDTCPLKKEVVKNLKLGTVCGECGCPISKKIFSPEFNACPKKKWEEVDKIYLPPTQKKSNTLL